MDLEPIIPWITGALAIIALLGHMKGFFGSEATQNRADIDTLEKKVIDHDRRIQHVEGELKHLPDKDSVLELKISMAQLRGELNTLTESVSSIGKTVHRIDDYLREEASTRGNGRG